MKLLPLGSVICINDRKVCVIGYGSVDKDMTSVCGYFVVSYPLGFTNVEKVFFIPEKSDFEIIADGYQTISSKKALDTLYKSFKIVENIPYNELSKFNETINSITLKRR